MTLRLLSLALLGSVLLAGSCHGRSDPRTAVTSSEPLAAHPAPEAGTPAPPAGAAPLEAAADPEPAQVPPEAVPMPARERIDFAADIQPLLEGCRPCHFEGGKVYDRLPFDRPATLLTLGERLFTRIKKEEEQALIRAFLAQENNG